MHLLATEMVENFCKISGRFECIAAVVSRSRGSEALRRCSGRSLVTDPRAFSGTYSRFIGGCQMDQVRR